MLEFRTTAGEAREEVGVGWEGGEREGAGNGGTGPVFAGLEAVPGAIGLRVVAIVAGARVVRGREPLGGDVEGDELGAGTTRQHHLANDPRGLGAAGAIVRAGLHERHDEPDLCSAGIENLETATRRPDRPGRAGR